MDSESFNLTSTRTRTLKIVFILLSVFLWGGLQSVAQEKSESSSPDKKKVLAFVGTAAGIARKMHSQSLVGYVAIYVDQTNWAALLKDSDLGPFLIFKEQTADRSAVILMSSVKEFVFCTYFDDSSPFGTVVLQPPGKAKIAVGQVEAAYKTVSPDMIQGDFEKLSFVEGTVSTDDGKPVPSFKITSEEQKTGK